MNSVIVNYTKNRTRMSWTSYIIQSRKFGSNTVKIIKCNGENCLGLVLSSRWGLKLSEWLKSFSNFSFITFLLQKKNF